MLRGLLLEHGKEENTGFCLSPVLCANKYVRSSTFGYTDQWVLKSSSISDVDVNFIAGFLFQVYVIRTIFCIHFGNIYRKMYA